MKLIHLVLFKTRVAIVNVTEPPRRGVGSCGDGSYLNLFHYEVCYNGTDRGTHRASKDLLDGVVFEVPPPPREVPGLSLVLLLRTVTW